MGMKCNSRGLQWVFGGRSLGKMSRYSALKTQGWLGMLIEGEPETGTAVRIIACADFSIVEVDEFFADGKAESAACFVSGGAAAELAELNEDAFEILW